VNLKQRPKTVLLKNGQHYTGKGYRTSSPQTRPRIPTVYIVVGKHRKFAEGKPGIGPPTEPYSDNLVYLGGCQREEHAWEAARQWLAAKCQEQKRPIEIAGSTNPDGRSLNSEEKIRGGIWLGMLYAYALEVEVWELPLLGMSPG